MQHCNCLFPDGTHVHEIKVPPTGRVDIPSQTSKDPPQHAQKITTSHPAGSFTRRKRTRAEKEDEALDWEIKLMKIKYEYYALQLQKLKDEP